MTRSFPCIVALAALLGAGCSQPAPEASGDADTPPTPPTRPALRLDLTNEAADASGPPETAVLLEVPADWRTRESFSGSWSQPADAPVLVLVAGGHDDGRRAGSFEAARDGQTFSIDLHPTFADNNVTLSFTLRGPASGAGQWGHSTIVGYREKGPVRVSMSGE